MGGCGAGASLGGGGVRHTRGRQQGEGLGPGHLAQLGLGWKLSARWDTLFFEEAWRERWVWRFGCLELQCTLSAV